MNLRALLLAPLMLFSACAPITAQQGQYTISGTVMSAATGQPLDRADVSLLTADTSQSDGQGQLIAETTTNADGRFLFAHLAAAKYSLRADRRGYLAAAYDEHEDFSTAIVTGEGLPSDGLVFRLAPHAVIGGTVADDSGDPVSQARISLYRQNTRNGLGNIVRVSSTTADDTGAYEFARLEPGNYFLAVSATPWYATQWQPRLDTQGNPAPDTTHAPLDVAYPTTFYSDVTDQDAATPIPVKAGDKAQINFALHAVPAVHLSFRIPTAPGQPVSMPQVQQEVFGITDNSPMQSMYRIGARQNGGTMTAETSGVAPGHYEVSLNSPGGASSRGSGIDITGDATFDTSQMEARADISGKVAMANGEKLPEHVSIALQGSDGQTPAEERVDPDGSFNLHGVPPASYQVHVNSNRLLSIARITASGATVEGHTLKVGSQPIILAATLVEGSTTIRGFAKQGGKPSAGVMVLLAPKHPISSTELIRRDQSASDGSFELRQVVPGNYTLVAVADGWALDWAKPEVLAPYLAKGQPVTVAPNARTIPLKDPIEVQAK